MGNSLQFDSLVTSTVSSITDDVPWSKQFTLLDKEPLNNTYILHHIPTNTSYKVKHMTLNKSQHQDIFRQIDSKKNTPSPFVTKLQKTQQYTVKGYCSQHEEVFLMYKYVETNLKEQILNRRFRQEKFLEEEIKVIMESGVKGISYLHGIGCTPKGLNTSEILLTSDRGVLVNDPWLGVGSALASTGYQQGNSKNIENIRQGCKQQQERSKIYSIPVQDYPSPQKLLYMNELIQQFDQWLSQLFTFGMIVLETIFMTALNEQMYDKGKRKIYYHRVKDKIQEIQQGVHLQTTQGQSNLLSEIKQDLRRLLSHQPKMRQTVYLKYKKTLNKNLLVFLKSQNHNSTQQDKNSISPSKYFNPTQTINNNNNYKNSNTNNNNQLTNVNSNYNNSNTNNYKQPETTIRRKDNWVLNSINQHHHREWLKQKQTQNHKFRVVSSSLPQKNYTKIPPQQVGDINPFKKKNDGLQLPYRQLGGMQSNNKSIGIGEYSHGSFQSRQNNFIPRMPYSNENTITINSQPIRKVYQNEGNLYRCIDYERIGNNSSYNFNFNNYNNTDTNNCDSQGHKFYSYPYKPSTTTTSTMPSSPYFSSTISTNAYRLSQISPTKQHNNLYYENDTNHFFNKYDSALNAGNILNNLPGHMITRSSSSYVLQDKPLPNNINSNNTDNVNNININKKTPNNIPIFTPNAYHSNLLYQQHQIVSKPSAWTYDSMVNVQNNNKETSFNNKETSSSGKSYIESGNQNSLNIQSSYQVFKHSFLKNNNDNTSGKNSNTVQSTNQQQKSVPTNINQSTPNPSPPKPSPVMPKLPSYKQLNNLHFREVGSLYYQDSHFSNDKESIVIQSYSGGIGMGKYLSGGLSAYKGQLVNGSGGNSSYMGPTVSPKQSLEINHSIINNTRNDGKSFSSMDEDVKQLRKFGQQQQQLQYQFDKKPNSSYSSSEKVSVIDKIYDHQLMGGYQRRSFEQKGISGEEDFGNAIERNDRYPRESDDHQEENNSSIVSAAVLNRCSEDLNTNRINKRTHTRNSSQNYLQTPQRYPAKYKHNSTIRQASCEDSGVNMSNGGDSYDHQKIHPNTETSNYQINDERRFSLRKLDRENDNHNLIENQGFNTERGTQRDKDNDIRAGENNSDQIIKNQQNSQAENLTSPTNKTHTVIGGQSVTLYADGSRYVGSTDEKSQSHGHGVLYYPDGNIAYEGQWQSGDFHGKGHLFNPYELTMQKSFDYRDLTRMDEYIKEFEGIFNHDVKEGKGFLKMHNNEVYQGEFGNDLPNGMGKFYCSDGNVVEGLWEKGYLQKTY